MFMTEEFFRKHIYPLMLSLFCSLGGLCLLCAFFGITESVIWLGVLFPILLLPIHFLSVNGKPFVFFLLFPFLGLCVFGLFVKIEGSVSALMQSYLEWWNGERSELLPPQLLLLLLPLLLIISILYLLQRNYWCRLFCAVTEVSLLATLCILHYRVGKASVVLFLGYMLFFLLETVFRFGHHGTDEEEQKSAARAAQLWPVVFLLMCLLAVLPVRSTPIRWNAFKNIWYTIASATNEVMHFVQVELFSFSSDFSIKFTGYDGSGKLGGELFENKRESMNVRTNHRLSNAVYLPGNTRNYYTGSSWETDVSKLPDELKFYSPGYLDSAELSYAVLRSGNYDYHDNYYLDSFYEIRFLDYRSTTLFAPTNTKRISMIYPTNNSFTAAQDGLRFERRMKRDTNYNLRFNQINLGSEEFLSLTETGRYLYDNSAPVSSDESLFRSDYSDLPKGDALDSLFALRRDYIYDNYLNLPDSLPQRVYDLAGTLTADAGTDYEKMLALEAYLRTLSYTTTPEEVPKERDLVDYFLFSSEEGYCTYYATALAVMGRCIGIPTRYVQGYCSYTPQLQGTWTIYSNNAHAWTECYIDGVGWIPLDATPGYESLRYQPWHKEQKEEPVPTPSVDRPDWFSSLQAEQAEAPTEAEEPKDDKLLLATLLICFSLLVLLLVLVTYILYRRYKLSRFIQTASPETRFYYEATQIFILTALLTNGSATKLFDHATLEEFTRAFTDDYPEFTKHALHFCKDYSCVRYGDYPVIPEIAAFAIQYRSELYMLLTKEKGKKAGLLYRLTELQRY